MDRTATAGPRAARSVTLMNELSSSVPPGFSMPNLKYPDGRSMRWPQSQYASNAGEQDYWEYKASIPVQKDDRVGQLLVQSTTPDGKPAMDPCKLAQKFWGGTGTCTIVDVGGKKVGVVTTNGRGSYDQWAAYRHDDGTVVYLAQAKTERRPAAIAADATGVHPPPAGRAGDVGEVQDQHLIRAPAPRGEPLPAERRALGTRPAEKFWPAAKACSSGTWRPGYGVSTEIRSASCSGRPGEK